jgi:hypothetical protein
MIRLHISSCMPLLVASMTCFCACSGAPEGTVGTDALEPTTDAHGAVHETIDLDGERIHYAVAEQNGLRIVRVTDEDGTVYGSWTTELDGEGMVGTFGGLSFGEGLQPEGTPTDESDPAPWRAVLDSRTGDVLRAVSDDARVLAANADGEPSSKSLEAVADLYPLLSALAEVDLPDIPEQTGVCSMAIAMYHSHWKTVGAYSCNMYHTGTTSRDAWSCDMPLYLQFYSSGLSAVTGVYSGNPSVTQTHVRVVSKNYTTSCRYTKHWAGGGWLNIASPGFIKKCSTCP